MTPRTSSTTRARFERDLSECAAAGVDVVFVPAVREMYPSWPEPPATTVSVHGVSERWEGASRPGHFDGVATVVAKLFAVAGPCRAYFGLKDFQQLAVVRAMAADLSLPVELVGCPIVREPDGLALSSRNVRLAADERAAATVLWRALGAGRAAVAAGERSGVAVAGVMRDVVAAEDLVHLDYAVAVDNATLREVADIEDPATVRLLVAAEVGPVRLIDNGAALDDPAPADPAPTDSIPSDSIPTDSIPTDTAPTDTVPTDTVHPTIAVPAADDAATQDCQLERIR